jgi:hypothetical protein
VFFESINDHDRAKKMDITVEGNELIDEYKHLLAESNHQLIMLQIAFKKAQARIREYEQKDAALSGLTVEEVPVRPQRARQVTPGLSGGSGDHNGSGGAQNAP